MSGVTIARLSLGEEAAVVLRRIPSEERPLGPLVDAIEASARDVESFSTSVRAIAAVGTAAVSVVGFAPFLRWIVEHFLQ